MYCIMLSTIAIPITKYGTLYNDNPSFTFTMWLISNLTTWMDRPHQNTQANYMVGKGV